MGAKTYVSDDLVEGIAYTVTPDANDPNTIHLTSLIKGATPLWVTPSGPSQKSTLDLALPFAGEYSVTFGASTPAGPVYGEPYTFKVETNNLAMLLHSADRCHRQGLHPTQEAYRRHQGLCCIGDYNHRRLRERIDRVDLQVDKGTYRESEGRGLAVCLHRRQHRCGQDKQGNGH